MVKKRKADGEPCPKCIQVEEQLRERGLWDKINRVVWAEENDQESEGMILARKHSIGTAPFFIVKEDGSERVYGSSLQFIKKELENPVTETCQKTLSSIPVLLKELNGKSPETIINKALELYGEECVISFSGAEDVVLIDMAAHTGKSFSVFTLDTGRLHGETYRFIQKVRDHYGIRIRVISPEREALEAFVEENGLTSFYKDGHKPCCQVRKIQPLKRVLGEYKAWITGQRKDQNPATRGELDVVQQDKLTGKEGNYLVKFNPLSDWSQEKVWSHIRTGQLPYNELHDRGYISIGCEPCTRPQQPGEHERASRWWWEDETRRECGLHS